LGLLAKVLVVGHFKSFQELTRSLRSPVVRATCASETVNCPTGAAIASKASLPSGTLEAMAKSDQAVPERRHYGDHRPYPDPPPAWPI
jgi:hypothetical protein